MNVTREVVTDLLPLYESGDASPDTRALVDQFLQSDPEFAQLVQALRTRREPRPAVSASPGPDVERDAVNRTRRALRVRSWIMGFAIFFTLVPFSFVKFSGQPTIFLWRDAPNSRLFLVLAVILWLAYLRQSWKLRPSGW